MNEIHDFNLPLIVGIILTIIIVIIYFFIIKKKVVITNSSCNIPIYNTNNTTNLNSYIFTPEQLAIQSQAAVNNAAISALTASQDKVNQEIIMAQQSNDIIQNGEKLVIASSIANTIPKNNIIPYFSSAPIVNSKLYYSFETNGVDDINLFNFANGVYDAILSNRNSIIPNIDSNQQLYSKINRTGLLFKENSHDTVTLPPVLFKNEFTIAFWFRSASHQSNQCIFSFADSSGNNNIEGFISNNSFYLRIQDCLSSSDNQPENGVFRTDYNIVNNQFHHLIIIVSNDMVYPDKTPIPKVRIFINGVLKRIENLNNKDYKIIYPKSIAGLRTNNKLGVSVYQSNTFDTYIKDGSLDDFKLYDYALSYSEIATINSLTNSQYIFDTLTFPNFKILAPNLNLPIPDIVHYNFEDLPLSISNNISQIKNIVTGNYDANFPTNSLIPNTSSLAPTNPITYNKAQVGGKSLYFNNNLAVKIPSFVYSGELTIAFWWYYEINGQTISPIINFQSISSDQNIQNIRLNLSVGNCMFPYCEIGEDSSDNLKYITTYPISINSIGSESNNNFTKSQFHHYSWVLKSSGWILYVNGRRLQIIGDNTPKLSLSGQNYNYHFNPPKGTIFNDNYLGIRKQQKINWPISTSPATANGYLDEFMMFNKGLSDLEIYSIFVKGQTQLDQFNLQNTNHYFLDENGRITPW